MDNLEYRRVMRFEPGDEKRAFLADRGILFLDEINESSSYTMALDLFYMHLSQANSTIWIILNSPGGEVGHGFAICDAIKALTSKGKTVNILGIGYVASMATAIMQAGTKRYSFSNTQFLVHQIRQTIPFFKQETEVNEGRERQQEMDRINDIVMKIIADRAGMELVEIKRLSEKKDYWLDAKGAMTFGKKGLIDEVVTELPF